MIVVDIETSGTNPYQHGILAIGAIDTLDCTRTFDMKCRLFEGAKVDKDALDYNGFSDIENKDLPTDEEIVSMFLKFIMKSEDHTLAGQNPAFDMGFLNATCERYKINNTIAKRTIDLHSVCITHLANRGKEYPVMKNRSALDSDSIMAYVGIPAEPRPHTSALTGALYEAEAFSRLLYGKNLLPQFKEFPIRF